MISPSLRGDVSDAGPAALRHLHFLLQTGLRFTCEGFLLLCNGCMLRPHDLAFVSGLVFLQKILWSAWFRTCLPLVSQYTLDALSALARMISGLSPTGLPVHSGCSECFGRHAFTLVSHLSPSGPPVHSGCSECFGPHDSALVSHLSSTTLHSLPAWFQACRPLVSTFLPVHSGCSKCFGPLDVALFSYLSPTRQMIGHERRQGRRRRTQQPNLGDKWRKRNMTRSEEADTATDAGRQRKGHERRQGRRRRTHLIAVRAPTVNCLGNR